MENNFFTIDLPIQNTSESKFLIKENIEHIVFDIGASYHAPNTKRNLNEKTFVVTVEPDPRMWISYMSMWFHTQKLPKGKDPFHLDDAVEPKFFENFVFIPCAVGEKEGFYQFNLSVRDGKSSMLKSNENYEYNQPQFKEVPVKVITLSRLIRMVPDDRRIDMIKIDCQGYDDRVILSGERNLHRVDFLCVEIGEHESQQYKNSYDVSSFRKKLDDLGFNYYKQIGGLNIFRNKNSNKDFIFDVN